MLLLNPSEKNIFYCSAKISNTLLRLLIHPDIRVWWYGSIKTWLRFTWTNLYMGRDLWPWDYWSGPSVLGTNLDSSLSHHSRGVTYHQGFFSFLFSLFFLRDYLISVTVRLCRLLIILRDETLSPVFIYKKLEILLTRVPLYETTRKLSRIVFPSLYVRNQVYSHRRLYLTSSRFFYAGFSILLDVSTVRKERFCLVLDILLHLHSNPNLP